MVNVVRLPSRKTKGTDATTNAVLSKTWMDWPQSYGFKRFLSPPTTSCQSAKAAEDFHVLSWTLMEHAWKAMHMWQESKNMTGIICSFTINRSIYAADMGSLEFDSGVLGDLVLPLVVWYMFSLIYFFIYLIYQRKWPWYILVKFIPKEKSYWVGVPWMFH